MRVFGLQVGSTISYPDLLDMIMKNVLKVACPTFKWHSDDIKSIRVIQGTDSQNSSLVIVSFKFEEDKYRVFGGRDLLRNVSIRVGDDLTYHQRQTLKRLKANEGKTGYFFKGKLCIRENHPSSEPSTGTERVYRQARRSAPPETTTPQQQMDHQ